MLCLTVHTPIHTVHTISQRNLFLKTPPLFLNVPRGSKPLLSSEDHFFLKLLGQPSRDLVMALQLAHEGPQSRMDRNPLWQALSAAATPPVSFLSSLPPRGSAPGTAGAGGGSQVLPTRPPREEHMTHIWREHEGGASWGFLGRLPSPRGAFPGRQAPKAAGGPAPLHLSWGDQGAPGASALPSCPAAKGRAFPP